MAWEVAFLHFGGCWGCWREKVVSVFRFGHSKSHFKTLLAKVLTFKCLKEMYCVNFKQGAGSTCDSVRVLSKPGTWSPLQKTKNSTLSRAHVASRINIPPVPPIQQRREQGRHKEGWELLSKPGRCHPAAIILPSQWGFHLHIQYKDTKAPADAVLRNVTRDLSNFSYNQDCGQFLLFWF